MNTTSHIEAFNAELMDAKREALAAIRAIVRTANQPKAEPGGDPRILAQARMAATQVLRTAFLKPEAPTTKRDREGASPTPAKRDREGASHATVPPQVNPDREGGGRLPADQPASASDRPPAPSPAPSPVDERRQRQIARIAEQARRDLERYEAKMRKREERDLRRAGDLTARAGAPSAA